MTANIIPRAPFRRRLPNIGTHYAFAGSADVLAEAGAFRCSDGVSVHMPGIQAQALHNCLEIIGMTGGMVAEAVKP